MRFSAVLLAGGMSRRMGRDKALLPWGEGLLWEHQLATLRALGPEELLISAQESRDYAAPGVIQVPDQQEGLGPLSGIAAALEKITTEWLVVLAVDLPQMPAEYLRGLLGQAEGAGKGTVPIRSGWYEPLAAIYPKRCLTLATRQLGEDDHSLQRLIKRALENELMQEVPVSTVEDRFFRNINAVSDL